MLKGLTCPARGVLLLPRPPPLCPEHTQSSGPESPADAPLCSIFGAVSLFSVQVTVTFPRTTCDKRRPRLLDSGRAETPMCMQVGPRMLLPRTSDRGGSSSLEEIVPFQDLPCDQAKLSRCSTSSSSRRTRGGQRGSRAFDGSCYLTVDSLLSSFNEESERNSQRPATWFQTS